MNILVLGDIHGRTCWKDIVSRSNYDKIIFLGDYVSSHEKISAEDQIENLKEILEFKENHPETVILLRGNHDMQHMGYYWAECSGYFRKVAEWMKTPENKERFLKNTQWIYIDEILKIIFAHAGISTEWMRYYGIESIQDINSITPNPTFGFTPCKMGDYTGISATQPCTWIRPWPLAEYLVPGYIQVVGHTPTNSRKIELYEDKIWLCDTLPYEYMAIETQEDKYVISTFKV